MAVGMLSWVSSIVYDKQYKILTIDGKVDSLEIINLDRKYKSEFRRDEISFKILVFEKALYIIAKHQPEQFRKLYKDMRNNDPEFFPVAEQVLKKIQLEYHIK